MAGHARARRLVRLVRLREWYYFLLLPLAGGDPGGGVARSALSCLRGAAVAFFVLGFGYLLNAASDVDVDVDARKNPLLDRTERRGVRSITGALALAAIALAATGPTVALWAAATSLVSGAVYSVGPRLKSVPIAGTLANATNFVPLLWVGAAMPDPPIARHLAPAFAGLLLQSQLLHEATDAREDARAGVRTTFSLLGRPWSAALAALFGAVPALSGDGMGAAARVSILAVYVVVFPLALAAYATDPRRAAKLRLWHRWSGIALGAALFVHGA